MPLNHYSQSVRHAILSAIPELASAERLPTGEGYWAIKHPSPYAAVELFVSTEDDEITVGMGGWHTHIDIHVENTEQGQIQHAIDLIRSIIQDRLVVAYATVEGEWSGSWIVENNIDTEPQENENISLRRWSRID